MQAAEGLFYLIVATWARLGLITLLALGTRPRVGAAGEGGGRFDDVTILVPAYQEAAAIDRTLRRLRSAVARGAGVIVVDDGSTDGAGDLAEAALAALGRRAPAARLRLLRHRRNRGKAAALSTGLAAVETRWTLTLDADTWLAPGALDCAAARMRGADAEQLAAVAFDVAIAPTPVLFAELQGVEYDASLNFERRGQNAVGAVSVAPGAASLWRTEALRSIGGFKDATATEDVDATLALAARGLRTAHAPGARAYTGAPATFRQLMAQRQRWSVGHYQNIPRHAPVWGRDARFSALTYPNFCFLSLFLPAMLILSAATLVMGTGGWRAPLFFAMGAWLVTVYGQRAVGLRATGRRTGVKAFLLEPFFTAAVHLSAFLLTCAVGARRLRGRATDLWRLRAR